LNSVKFGKSNIRYRIQKSSKRKTTEILVDRTGVQVLSPKQKSSNQINGFIQKHAKWIYRKQLVAKEEKIEKISYQNGTRLPYLGKNYLLEVKEVKGKESFMLRNGKFIARVNKISKPKLKKLFIEWSRQKSLPNLEKSVKKYSKKLGIKTGKILVKNQKNRWGSLSKKGTINFNQNLIRAPPKIIEYVIAHEVCHLKIPNHSTSYWRLLGTVMANFDERKEWLRLNKSLFE